MKKKIFWLVMVLLGAVLTAGLHAGAADDYHVIKNAVKRSAAAAPDAKHVQWFKLVVTGKGNDKEKVKLTLPVSLIEMMVNSCSQEKFHATGNHEIELRRVWADLKQAGPQALVEIEDGDETVKIWLECATASDKPIFAADGAAGPACRSFCFRHLPNQRVKKSPPPASCLTPFSFPSLAGQARLCYDVRRHEASETDLQRPPDAPGGDDLGAEPVPGQDRPGRDPAPAL
jgi:hypothetical protein